MMSFFYKLFGIDDKKKQVTAPPPPRMSEAEYIAERIIKFEAALNQLDAMIKD
jgi:hypothetical protein